MSFPSELKFSTSDETKMSKFLEAIELINYAAHSTRSQRYIANANMVLEGIGISARAGHIERQLRAAGTVFVVSTCSQAVSFQFDPSTYPTELCEVMFPMLDELGAEAVRCEVFSEYGNLTLTRKDAVTSEIWAHADEL